MAPSVRVASLAALATLVAAALAGCAPPGAINERAVLESTPHSEPAAYAKSQEDYNRHMIDRYTKGKPKSFTIGKRASQGKRSRGR
jgi:hypothetical protein